MTTDITCESEGLLGPAGWWLWFLDDADEVRASVGAFETEPEAIEARFEFAISIQNRTFYTVAKAERSFR